MEEPFENEAITNVSVNCKCVDINNEMEKYSFFCLILVYGMRYKKKSHSVVNGLCVCNIIILLLRIKFYYTKHQYALLMCDVVCKCVYEFLLTNQTNAFRRKKVIDDERIPASANIENNGIFFIRKRKEVKKLVLIQSKQKKTIHEMQEIL